MLEIIPKISLDKWAVKKFFDQQSTMDLFAVADSIHDKAVIAIVALLEVEPAKRYRGIPEEEAKYIKSCHYYLRDLVSELREAKKKDQ